MYEELKLALGAMCNTAKQPSALSRYLGKQTAQDYGTSEGAKKRWYKGRVDFHIPNKPWHEMKNYIKMPVVNDPPKPGFEAVDTASATDSGTSEGAKKGWEKRKHALGGQRR